MTRPYRRRYNYGWNKPTSGTAQSDKPLIFWDPERNAYVLKTPFSEKFRNDIQVVCHSAIYLGKNEQAWSIHPDDLESAKVCVEANWGEFDFIPKEEREQAKFSMGNGSAANNAALTMFTIAGPESARKVYLMLIKQFHSDVNPSSEDATKAAEINVAWDQLKKELGW